MSLCKQVPKQKMKKLVSVSATFLSITQASKKTDAKALEGSKLQQVLFIHYFTQFDKFLIELLIETFIYLGVEVSTMQ